MQTISQFLNFSISQLFLVLFFMFFWGDVGWAQPVIGAVNDANASGSASGAGGGNCGVFSKLGGVPESYTGDIYYDRFGNIWTADEITALSASVIDECDAGVFKLSFSGEYTQDEKDQTCAALSYLSGLVGGNAPAGVVPIKIEFTTDFAGAGAASLFMQPECGTMRNLPLVNIRTGINALPIAFYAGLIKINSAINWYTGAMPADLAAWNAMTGKVDLYTAVLHEGMHILGIASTFGGVELQGGGVLQNIFTEWDRYLYKKDAAPSSNYTKLIQSINDPVCCSKHGKNPAAPTTFNGSCDDDIFFRLGNVNLAEISYLGLNPTNISSTNNRLSHIDIDCGSSGAQYVMHPGIYSSPDILSFPRRVITAAEQTILQKIGYSIQSCTISLTDDLVPEILFLDGVNEAQSYIAYQPGKFSLNTNDVIPNNIFVNNVEIFDVDAGILVTPNFSGTSLLYLSIKGVQEGTWTFKYRYNDPNCGCDEAVVTVRVLKTKPSTLCTANVCNQICFGDFDDFLVGTSTYYPSLGLPAFYFPAISNQMGNTPDIHLNGSPQINNKIVRWGRISYIGVQQESLRIPLSQSLSPGCTLTVNYQSAYGKNGPFVKIPDGKRIEVYGLSAPPCTAIAGIPEWGPIQTDYQFCPGVTAYRMDQYNAISFDEDRTFDELTLSYSNLDLVNHTFTYTHPIGATPITDLLVWGTYNPDPLLPTFSSEGLEFYLDNISATSSCVLGVTITPTIVSQCLEGQAIIKYEVCLAGPGASPVTININAAIPAGLTIVPNNDFNTAGESTFQLTPNTICGTSNTKTITLVMNVSPNFDPGQAPILVPIPISYSGVGLCTAPSSGNNGEVTLELQSCNPTTISCGCEPSTAYEFGFNMFSVTKLSATGTPTELADQCIKLNGTLLIDKSWKLTRCRIIMGEGARLIVRNNSSFEIYTATSLVGCTKMWRGITIESGSTFISNGKSGQNTINDAQYAVKPLGGAKMAITYTQFDRNYIGIYTASTANGGAQSITTTALAFNKFLGTGDLKAPFYGQSLVTKAYAMAELNNTVGIDFQQNNVADGLANGLIANRSSFTMDRCTIKNTLQLPTYPIQQRGVFAENCANVKLTFNRFEQNKESIYSTASNIDADQNTIVNKLNTYTDYFWGIIVKDGNGRITRLSENKIDTWGPGIMVSNCKSPVSLGIRGNTINLQVGSHAQIGGQPSVPGAAIDLDGCDNGIIWGNKMYNKFSTTIGDGLFMNKCNTNTVAENKSYSHVTGYRIDGCTSNYFYGNDAVQQVQANRIGFEVSNSVNTYCTNYTDSQTQEGWYFFGACTPSAFSCNQIVSADYGLFLTEQTEIGLQNKKGNQWLGAYGSWGAYHASTNADFVLKSQFSMPAVDIPTWGTASGSTNWFLPFNVATNCNSICPTPNDTEFGGHGSENYGSSEADIRAAKSEHSGVGMNWMGQQRLYQRLQKGTSEAQSNTDVQTFYGDASNGAIGQLNCIAESSSLLLSRDNAQQAQLAQLQKSLTNLNAALMTSKEAGAGTSSVTNWENQLRALQGQLLQQMNQLYGHDNWIKQQIGAGIPAILAENAAIAIHNTLADNEKSLNTLALQNGFFLSTNPPATTVLNSIKAIADQCPLEGGFAVYEARSAYRRYFPNTYWNDRDLCGMSGERTTRTFPVPQTFVVQPNPANEQFMVRATQPTEQAIRIDLYYATGQLVSSKWINKGTSDAVFGTANLPNGIYIYRINTPTSIVQTGKMVIAH